jgi:hypothetical protein
MMGARVGMGRVKEDWTFEIRGLFGRSFVSVAGAGAGGGTWAVKRVTYNGDDVSSTGIDPGGQARLEGLQVVLTSRTGRVAGVVTDSRSRPVSDYVVVIFPADEARWTLPTASAHIRVGRPNQEGRYTIGGLLGGDYLAVALEWLENGTESDPELLASLKDSATAVRVGDGEEKALNLELATNP